MSTEQESDGLDLTKYTWTFSVTIGDLHPAALTDKSESDAKLAKDTALLNKCLKTGRIIGKTQSAASFAVGENGEHHLMTGAVTFIVGFTRRPYWLPEAPDSNAAGPSA